MERWYVEDIQDDPDNLAVGAGIEWLAQRASELGEPGAVLVPVARQIEELVRAVSAIGSISFSPRDQQFNVGGTKLDVVTHAKAFNWGYAKGPIFVVWGARKGIEVAEEMRPPVLLVLEWNEGELEEWKATWGPINLASGQPSEPAETPAVIIGALRDLSLGDRDIVHPLDKGRAIDTLKMLRLGGVRLDPGVIRAEARRQGWPSDGAGRLEELAKKVAEGRQVKGGRGRISEKDARDAVEHWKQRADGSSP